MDFIKTLCQENASVSHGKFTLKRNGSKQCRHVRCEQKINQLVKLVKKECLM